jgi:hypothetical protein
MLERLGEIVNGDEALVRRGRYFSDTFMLEVGETQYLIEVRQGRIENVETGPFVMRSWTFAIRAAEEVWREFWRELPRPGYHDIFALLRHGRIALDGELQPLMANLLYVKEVIAAPRKMAAAA